MTANDLTIEHWPISRPKPYQKNARKISSAAVEKVRRSIVEFGWRQPIVVDDAGVIIVGHTRLQAAEQLGLSQVPVHVARGLTPDQVRAYRLADNRTHDEAQWDMGLLAVEMSELRALGVDLASTAFDGIEADRLVRAADKEGDEQANAIVHPPANPISRAGDLWQLGPHRVMCGDSGDPAVITRLLAGARPRLMVTDPPYGVEYDASWRAAIKSEGLGRFGGEHVGAVSNDNQADWTANLKLFPGDVAYAWCSGLHSGEARDALVKAGFEMRAQIIWAKQQLVMSRGHYHWQHEPCWYGVRKGRTAHWRGDRKQTTVWQIKNLNPINGSRDEAKHGHSTQKPLECMRRPILNHTETGDGVYDPFLGSGSTLVAADQTDRVCWGAELDPRYVDVIVKRWQDLQPGRAAVLDGDGRSFGDIGLARRAS